MIFVRHHHGFAMARAAGAGDDSAQQPYFRLQVWVLVCEQKGTLDTDY